MNNSDLKFNVLADTVSALIFIYQNETIIYANKAAERISGYPSSELKKMRYWDIVHPDFKEITKKRGLSRFKNKNVPENYEFKIITKKGEERWLDYTAAVFQYNGKPAILGTAFDITIRKRIEEELKIKAQLLDAATDSIFLHDFDGNFIYVNETAYRSHGYTKDELMNMNLRGLDVPEHAKLIKNRMKELVERGKTVFEVAHYCKDKSIIPVEIHARIIEVGDQKLILSVARDITRRKKEEQELLHLSQIKSEFTSMVSHELRSPLSSIKEGIDIILEGIDGPVTKAQEETLAITKRNVDRLVNLVNEVLDFSKLDSGKMKMNFKPSNVNELVKEVYYFMNQSAKKRKIEFNMSLPQENLTAICDADKIKAVIINLVDNALKFTKEKGTVDLRLGAKLDNVQIEVCDTGIGIKKEDQKKIFEMFSQVTSNGYLTPGGSGLGLTICKKIIDYHKGNIFVESMYGKGSRFVVELSSG